MSEKYEVKRVPRQVIERKLLNTLSYGDTVACLFDERDLRTLWTALNNYEGLGEDHKVRALELLDGLERLLKEAFPKSDI